VALSYEHWSSDGWYEQSIDDVTHSSYSVATAMDPSGRMHVVYHVDEHDYNAIKHAVRSGGTWEISTVTASSDYITNLNMVIGEDSVVRVAWWDSGEINYATNAGGEFEVVSAEIDEEIQGISMTMDPAGNAHALVTTRHFVDTYPAYNVYKHEYWAISSDEWALVQTYDAPEQTGVQYVQKIVVDGQNDPCAFIWFRYNFPYESHYALASTFLGDSPLEFHPLFMYSDTSALMDAEYNSTGQVHLLIRDSSYEPSRLVHWGGDGLNWDRWAWETIDYAGDSSWTGADLFMDPQDNIFVAYSSVFSAFSTRQCEVAEQSEDGWTINALRESGSDTWISPSLVVDSEGVFHVVGLVSDGVGTMTMTYTNSDGHEVLMQSLSDAALYTVIAVVIGWPSAFALIRWQELRRADREKRASMGLYDEQLRKAP